MSRGRTMLRLSTASGVCSYDFISFLSLVLPKLSREHNGARLVCHVHLEVLIAALKEKGGMKTLDTLIRPSTSLPRSNETVKSSCIRTEAMNTNAGAYPPRLPRGRPLG